MIVRCTVGLGSGYGVIGNTCYLPAGSRYTGFEVYENYHDGTLKPGHMGRRLPAHHSVMLRLRYEDEKGEKQDMSVGGWVRKSETQRPEWQSALHSPVLYM